MNQYRWVRHLFPPVQQAPPTYATGETGAAGAAFAAYIDDILIGVRTIVPDTTGFTEDVPYLWRFRIYNGNKNVRLIDIEWEFVKLSSGSQTLRARGYDVLNQAGNWQDRTSDIQSSTTFAFDSVVDPRIIKAAINPAENLENGVYGTVNAVYEHSINGALQEGSGITLSPVYDSNNVLIGYDDTGSTFIGNGGFDLRGLAISNLRVEESLFDPSEGSARIKGDVLALPASTSNYSNGWTPSSDVQSILTVKSGDALIAHLIELLGNPSASEPGSIDGFIGTFPIGSFPSSPGKVAELDFEWKGTLDINGSEIPLSGLAGIFGDCGAANEENDLLVVSRKKPAFALLQSCGCKSGCNVVTTSTGQPGTSTSTTNTYRGCQLNKDTGSLGYGWSSVGTERIIEDLITGNISMRTSSGNFVRWLFDGTNYNPANPSNYLEMEKDNLSTSARYKVTFKNQMVYEFNSDNRLERILDRNGNQTVFTYLPSGHLEKTDDLRGRTQHYDYGSRTDGQPVSIRANNPVTGRQTQFEYHTAVTDSDNVDKLYRIIDPENNVTEFSYYDTGALETITDPRGFVSKRFFYDSLGRVTKTENYDEMEIENRYGFNSSRGLDFVETFVRDLSTTDPELDRYNYAEYDIFGNQVRAVSLVDGLFVYNPVTETVELVGNTEANPIFTVTDMFYNDSGSPYLMTARVDPNLKVVEYEYDSQGNVTKFIDKRDEEINGYVATYTYADTVDPAPINPKHRNLIRFIQRPTVTVDGTPTIYQATEFRYDPDGNLERIIDAASEEVFMEYSLDGLIEKVTDRRGHTTEFEYFGTAFDGVSSRNLETLKVPKGETVADGFRTISIAYDNYDNVVSVTNELGHQVSAVFDELDRPLTITDGRGSQKSYQYNAGLLDGISFHPNNGSAGPRETVFLYDDSSRIERVERDIASSAPRLVRVNYKYSNFSELKALVRLKDGVEKSAQMSYDQLGRQVSSKDSLNRDSLMAYAPFCSEKAETSARGIRRLSTSTHRCLPHQILVGEPDVVDSLGLSLVREVQTFTHDELGRMVIAGRDRDARYFQSVQGIDKYVEGGQFTNVRFYIYDELDRLTEMTFEDGRTAYFEYDGDGNLTKTTDTQGKVTRYEHYRDNLLHKVILERGGQDVGEFVYSYDAAGRLDEIEYPLLSGIRAVFRDAVDTPGSGFDENGNLRFLRYEKQGLLHPLRSFEWRYDQSNNREFMLDVDSSRAVKWEYGFDYLDRLITVKRAEAPEVASLPSSPLGASTIQREYLWDESDNRTFFDDYVAGMTYHYVYSSFNDAGTIRFSDQLEEVLVSTTVGERDVVTPGNFVSLETFLHDADGNLTKRISNNGDEASFEWSDFDRLHRVEEESGGQATRLQDNRYDLGGLRNRKLDKNGNSSFEHGFGISGSTSTPGVSASASPSLSYLQGHIILGAEIDDGSGPKFIFHLSDALGTTRDVVDSSGNVIKSFEFSEYGDLLSLSGSSIVSPKTWLGGISVNDDSGDSGMFNMGHRNYISKGLLGRFISRDPIGYAGGLNPYTYADNNPVTYSDPTGLQRGPGTPHLYEPYDPMNLEEPVTIQSVNLPPFLQGFGNTLAGGVIVAAVIAALPFELPACIGAGVIGAGIGAVGYNGRKLYTGKEPISGRDITVDEWDRTAGSMLALPFVLPAGYKGPAHIGSVTSFEAAMVRGVPRFGISGRTLNVAGHSNQFAFGGAGESISVGQLAAMIRSVPGYRPGMSVRLISCEGAAHAEALSAELGGVTVYATSPGAGGLYPLPFPLAEKPFQAFIK